MGYSSPTEEDVVRPSVKPLRRRRFGVPTRRRPKSPSLESVSSLDDRPRVTFQESQNQVHYVESPVSLMLMEDDDDATPQRKLQLRQQLWYQKSDIQEFRRDSATISLQWRAGQVDEKNEVTRGLELRTSLDRQKRKQLILRRVLDVAQDCEYDDPLQLAHVASSHSSHSRKVALAQAHFDYYSVYHPKLISSLPYFDRLRCPTVLQDVGLHKRSCETVSQLQQTGRRVRCRMW